MGTVVGGPADFAVGITVGAEPKLISSVSEVALTTMSISVLSEDEQPAAITSSSMNKIAIARNFCIPISYPRLSAP